MPHRYAVNWPFPLKPVLSEKALCLWHELRHSSPPQQLPTSNHLQPPQRASSVLPRITNRKAHFHQQLLSQSLQKTPAVSYQENKDPQPTAEDDPESTPITQAPT